MMKKIDTQLIDALADDLRVSVLSTGTERVVLGLSGGIDSALSAALAVKALGKGNVLGYALPCRESSPESLEDARLVADYLDISLQTVSIADMAEAYAGFDGLTTRRRGNIFSRLRMLMLFDKSAERGALVLGTGNKSEILLGYMTWFGDSACSVNPLGDMYKTQVYQASTLMGIPEKLITKAPSADLYKGQSDEAELGYSYEELDRLLYMYTEERKTREQLREAGLADEFIENVLTRVEVNAYKRRMPKILSIGQRRI